MWGGLVGCKFGVSFKGLGFHSQKFRGLLPRVQDYTTKALGVMAIRFWGYSTKGLELRYKGFGVQVPRFWELAGEIFEFGHKAAVAVAAAAARVITTILYSVNVLRML
jgi:hypothetical protein